MTDLTDRSYRELAPCPGDNREMGDLTFYHLGFDGPVTFVADTSPPTGSFRLPHACVTGVSVSRDALLIGVALVRRGGAPAFACCNLVNMMHAAVECSTDAHLHENGDQFIPLAGVAKLEPGDLLDTSSSTLLQVPIEAVLPGTQAPAPFPCDTNVHAFTVSGAAAAYADSAQQHLQPPQSLDPFVHHLSDKTSVFRNNVITTPPPDNRAFNPAQLDRVSTDQLPTFKKERNRLSLRQIAFDSN